MAKKHQLNILKPFICSQAINIIPVYIPKSIYRLKNIANLLQYLLTVVNMMLLGFFIIKKYSLVSPFCALSCLNSIALDAVIYYYCQF
jgi:hypothetical protein